MKFEIEISKEHFEDLKLYLDECQYHRFRTPESVIKMLFLLDPNIDFRRKVKVKQIKEEV